MIQIVVAVGDLVHFDWVVFAVVVVVTAGDDQGWGYSAAVFVDIDYSDLAYPDDLLVDLV